MNSVWVQDPEYRILDYYRILDTGFMIQDPGNNIFDPASRIMDPVYMVPTQDLGAPTPDPVFMILDTGSWILSQYPRSRVLDRGCHSHDHGRTISDPALW